VKRATYFSNVIVEKIDAFEGKNDQESFSGRVGFLIDAAVSVAKASVPSLRVEEWMAIADALNGSFHSYEAGMENVLSGAWHDVFDSAFSANSQFEIDAEALAKRLLRAPISEQLAVFEIVRSFWKKPGVGETYSEIFANLGAPGLVVKGSRPAKFKDKIS
jgi:hypothetical protein